MRRVTQKMTSGVGTLAVVISIKFFSRWTESENERLYLANAERLSLKVNEHYKR